MTASGLSAVSRTTRHWQQWQSCSVGLACHYVHQRPLLRSVAKMSCSEVQEAPSTSDQPDAFDLEELWKLLETPPPASCVCPSLEFKLRHVVELISPELALSSTRLVKVASHHKLPLHLVDSPDLVSRPYQNLKAACKGGTARNPASLHKLSKTSRKQNKPVFATCGQGFRDRLSLTCSTGCTSYLSLHALASTQKVSLEWEI